MSSAQTQTDDYATAQAQAIAAGEEFDGQLGDSAAAFQTLGVSVTDANGNLRDSEAVFSDAITALGGIKNEAERDALAMSIFGKSAMELNPLIKAGADELANLSQQAHEVGAVMSEEDVAAFEEFDDTLASVKMGLQGTLGTLAGAFLPGFQNVLGQAGGYLTQFRAIVDGSGGDIGAMASGVGGLISTIIADVAAQAPQLMQAGMSILMSIVNAIVTNLPTMITAGVEMLLSLVNGLVTALPAIIEAGLKALIALAMGITQALPTLIPTLVGVILKIVEILIANLPMLIDAALQLILALAQGLIAAIPILIPAIPVIMQAVFDALIQALPMIATAAAQLISVLSQGFIENIPMILSSAVQLISVLVNYLRNDAVPMLLEVGKNLVTGLWNGIKNSMAWLKANFVAEMMKVLDSVKSALGISSPSSLIADEIG
jgi:phage-related protein